MSQQYSAAAFTSRQALAGMLGVLEAGRRSLAALTGLFAGLPDLLMLQDWVEADVDLHVGGMGVVHLAVCGWSVTL